MKRESSPSFEMPLLGTVVAQEAAPIIEEYKTTLERAKDELGRELDWIGTLKAAYGLDEHKFDQIGRSYNRLKFWQARIAEYERLLAPFVTGPAEVTP